MITIHLMKKKIIFLCLAAVLIFCLTGCGSSALKDGYSSEAKEEPRDFTNLSEILKQLYLAESFGRSDYTYGKGNERASYLSEALDPSCPILTFQINPLATDEVIDDNLSDIKALDDYLMEIKAYRKFIKENGAYYVTAQYRGDEICRISLNGKADYDDARKVIRGVVTERAPEMEESIAQFHEYLNQNDEIEKADDGSYYFVIDSKHVMDSVKRIINSLEEIREHDPLLQDEFNYYSASAARMGYIDGTYLIYLDEFGGDILKEHPNSEGDGVNLFLSSPFLVYNQAYEWFVDTGRMEAGELILTYYSQLDAKGEIRMYNLEFGGRAPSNTTVTEEELYEELYRFYDNLYAKHEEHGMEALTDLPISGAIRITGRTDGFYFDISAKIPMEEHLSYEEFKDVLVAGSRYFDPAEFELEDDCLE